MREDAVDIIIAIGPAGTGKTMLACYAAVEALRLGKVNKIVVTRPVVSVDEEIGFLPGGLESKMDPWTRPIFDTLRETYSAKEIERMTEEGIIEIVPLGFMRGRTFKNAWIIADEMQNSSPTQMFMLATRIGEGSKMIITGDLYQSDLNTASNGLLEINKKLRHSEKFGQLNYIRYIELDKQDVQRSRAAKSMLDIWEMDYRKKVDIIPEQGGPKNMGNESPVEDKSQEDDDGVGLQSHIYTDYNEDTRYANEFAGETTLSEYDKDYLLVDLANSSSSNSLTSKHTPPVNSYTNRDNDAALIPLSHIRQLGRSP
jgi:phosphate starvation-inducible PhoH-like protein